MLAALAGICYAMAVGDDGCRWENDILCGGTARSPGALQPNNGDAPGNGAHAQQQQERLTPYELEKKNEEDNEIQPTIFRGGAKHTMNDGHGHGSEKSADEHTLDDGHKHTKNLKSKYTGCRWENDVHCGGTAAFPGGGTGTKPPTKEEIAAAKKAKHVADSDDYDDELSVDDDAVSSSPCTTCNRTCNPTCNPACPARSPVYLACAPAACRRCSAYAL